MGLTVVRRARVTDYKRRLREREADWPVQFLRFGFADIPTIGSGELSFSHPFVIVAGSNGVGKTTVLQALWATAAPHQILGDPSTHLKLSAGQASLNFRFAGQDRTASATFTGAASVGDGIAEVDVVHIDAATQSRQHQREFSNFQDMNDIINGVGSRVVDANILLDINYICRREYRELKVYEIEADGGAVPFFEASYGNDRYDSRTMGSGELASLHLWWTIERLPRNALLLIEEPETYLAPASQENFANFLIREVVDRHLSVILTTHSPKIINSLSEDYHVYLYREAGSVRVVQGTPPPALLSMLGIDSRVDIVTLVEDQAAEMYLRLILERHKPALSRRIEISTRNGDGNIIKVLERLEQPFQNVKVIGLFDGDMRGKLPQGLEGLSTFLPGSTPIESIFRQLVQSEPSEIAIASGIPDIGPILHELEGAEQHDWFSKLSENLGLSKEQLFLMLYQLWERQPGNLDGCHETLNAIGQLISLQE